LRKLTLAVVFAFLFLAQFVSAQQVDFFMGGGTLLSSSGSAGSNPSMGGGTYLNLGGDVLPIKHFGVNVETAWLATQGAYGSGTGLNYRPIFTDFNFLYQPHIGKRLGLDLMAGIGAADTRFYEPGPSTPGYANYESTDHFMEHFGAGLRFYVGHHIFVRPEIHYYYIQNNNGSEDANFNFNSNSAIRAGASIGYTFGGGSD
jgi:hypothetical protein